MISTLTYCKTQINVYILRMVFIKFFCCFEDQEKREELCKELEISEIKEKIVRWEISGKRHM